MSQLAVKRLDSPLTRQAPPRPASPPQPVEALAPPDDPLAALPQPPALDEPLELISSRLPTSLRRSLSDLTGALRSRDGRRFSQKQLPEQELLAVLVWLAGSAEDPRAVERLGHALDAFRARRFAAAAEALASS
jgi:hypothetical protein